MGRQTFNWKKRVAVIAAITLGAAISANVIVESTPLRVAEYKIFDQIVQQESTSAKAKSDVVLVVIDDQSRATIPEPLAYWQPHLATVVSVLQKTHARVVGLDMIFSAQDARAIAESKQMAQVMMEASTAGMPVILGYDASVQPPATPLYTVASTSSPRPLGYLNLPADADDFVRRFEPCQVDKTDPSFSLGVRVAAAGLGQDLRCGEAEMSGRFTATLNKDRSLTIPFGHTADPEKISLVEVLSEAQRNDLGTLSRQFAGKLVIVGSDESQDRHATPLLGVAGRMPGMQIHATIAQSIYSGLIIHEASARTVWLTTLLFALLAATVAFGGRWQISVVSMLLVVALSITPAAIAWPHGIVLSGAKPLLSSFLAGSAAFLFRYRTEILSHRRLRAQFGQFVSPEIVRQIIEDGIELGGTRRKVTVLFSDIRSFTTLSEKIPPEDLVKQLNEYLSAMTEIIISNGGYLDKFIGDGILAMYGAPVSQKDDAWMAVVSADQMIERLKALNSGWEAQGRPALKIGIGIHTGEAIVGNIGSSRKLEYTAVGDTVNTASRVESKTKDAIQRYGEHILISGATADEIERVGHRADIFPMEAEQLKGKTEFTELFVLRGLRGAGRKGSAANA